MLSINTSKKMLWSTWLMTLSLLSCTSDKNTVTDVDGNVYHTVQIGNQTWMVENLRVTRFNNGDPIVQTSDNATWEQSKAPAYAVYNNDTSLQKDYGLLYNWHAIQDERKLAPKGWRIPTEADIRILQQLILSQTDKKNWYLKDPGNRFWLSQAMQSTDTLIGFSALPGGYRDKDGSFHMLQSNGYYWLEHNSLEFYHWSHRFFQAFADVRRDAQFTQFGFSVKCIKNE